MSIQLKIKSKSLAAEARIIRAAEIKLLKRLRDVFAVVRDKERVDAHESVHMSRLAQERLFKDYGALHSHRRGAVRVAARRTLIARTFLRGGTYRCAENRTSDGHALTEQDWTSIESMVVRYGAGDLRERMLRFREWKEAARSARADV